MSEFIIYGRLDGPNEYTSANRSNRYKGSQMKLKNESIVIEAIKRYQLNKIKKYPIKLKITWYEKNKRRDVDNITFATKFIQDALVKQGILIDDGQKYINKISHDVQVDKEYPRIEVELIENGYSRH